MFDLTFKQMGISPPVLMIILAFLALIFVISLIDLIIVVRKGPSNPWVDTIIEMLPVIGLLGTFVGAFLIFLTGNSHSLTGIIFAFVVSAFGWFCYLVLHLMRASYTKKWQEESPSPVEDTRSLNEEIIRMNDNSKNAVRGLSNIHTKLQKINELLTSIGKTIEANSLEYFIGNTADLNSELEGMNKYLESIDKSLIKLQKTTKEDFSVNIEDSYDYDESIDKLNRLAESLTKLSNAEQQHRIDINYNSNYNELDTALSNISRAMIELGKANHNLNIQIDTPEDLVQIHRQLEGLNTALNSLDKSPKEQSIVISTPANLESVSSTLQKTENSLSNIAGSLDAINDLPKDHKVSVKLPLNTSQIIEDLNKIGEAFKNLPESRKDLSYKVKLHIFKVPGSTFFNRLFQKLSGKA